MSPSTSARAASAAEGSLLLHRLRIRQKFVLLLVPLLALVVAGTVPLVAGRVAVASRSMEDVRVVQRAVRIGGLVQDLQQERLASLGYLAGAVRRDNMVARTTRAVELARQLAADYGSGSDRLSAALREADGLSGPGGIRPEVLARQATGIAVFTGFTAVIDGLIGVLGLFEHVTVATTVGRLELALDAIVRHDEANAAAGAALFVEPELRVTTQVVALVGAGLAVRDRERDRFVEFAEPSTVDLYRRVATGPSGTRLAAYQAALVDSPSSHVDSGADVDLLARVESLTSLGRLVGDKVAAQVVSTAHRSAVKNRWLAGVGVGAALLVLVAAGFLSMLITRSVTRPLRRLIVSANEVADIAAQELERVADTDDPEAAVPRLRPVRVGTSDELGELASAFNRVQQAAASLVERQLVSRQNVARMFGNVGRRTQNLVGRQLAVLDSLEQKAREPALLDRLYRLDHVSTRLRRNANSLVVLSGAGDQQISAEPLTLADAVGAAMGEIEGFRQVRLGAIDPALLTPQVAIDATLLLAELLENGTSFSPPHIDVEVDARFADDGDVLVRIVDRGLGMTAQQLEVENARLVERERLDLAPTDVLGLFVVGRLARRHRIGVLLASTPGGGVSAEVRIPKQHVIRAERPPAPAAAIKDAEEATARLGARDSTDPPPWPRPASDEPAEAERSSAALREFEAAVRRALATVDELSAGLVPDPAMFFERRVAGLGPVPSSGRPVSDGDHGLPRRTPGAHLPADALDAQPGLLAGSPATAEVPEQAAAAARALVDSFEAGVERAMRYEREMPG